MDQTQNKNKNEEHQNINPTTWVPKQTIFGQNKGTYMLKII
jgi:hypothetical protein